MHEHYQKALALQREIGTELAKDLPKRAVLRAKTLEIYSEMLRAEHEQLKLDSAMEIREPQRPVEK